MIGTLLSHLDFFLTSFMLLGAWVIGQLFRLGKSIRIGSFLDRWLTRLSNVAGILGFLIGIGWLSISVDRVSPSSTDESEISTHAVASSTVSDEMYTNENTHQVADVTRRSRLKPGIRKQSVTADAFVNHSTDNLQRDAESGGKAFLNDVRRQLESGRAGFKNFE